MLGQPILAKPGPSIELRSDQLTRMATEAEAAAYVASPAKATLIVYFPPFTGAVVFTEATPELFVVAVKVAPLSVKVIVRLAIAALGPCAHCHPWCAPPDEPTSPHAQQRTNVGRPSGPTHSTGTAQPCAD